MPPTFDDYATNYERLVQRSIGFFGQDHDFYVRVKADRLLALIREYVGSPSLQRVLDVGCGPGIAHRHLKEVGTLEGADLSGPMLTRARRENPRVRYHIADARELPFEPRVFDVVFAVGLLHHVDGRARDSCLREFRRVVRDGGLVVIFEHNPLNPLARLAVHRCEFDRDAVLLTRRETAKRLQGSGFGVIEQRYILILPWRGRVTGGLERVVGNLPLGAQYYVAAKPEEVQVAACGSG